MKLSNRLYKNMVKRLGQLIESGKLPEYDATQPIETDENAKLNFIVWGDPQISFLSPLRSARVYSAVKDISNMKGRLDALVLAGDITEYGAWCEYRMMAELLRPVSEKMDKLFAVSGNHDIRLRRYRPQLQKFNRFLSLLPAGVLGNNQHYYFSSELKGYKFIMLGADRAAFEGSYISAEQLSWLDSELASSDKSKPVFVFNHQPLKHTNGLPVTFLGKGKWRGSVGNESEKLRAVFEKYNNVIYITGHLHYCTSEYSYEDCQSFKAISVPTVGVLNHGSFGKMAQGYVFRVYDDKIIAQSRVFGEGKYTHSRISNAVIEIAL